MSKRRDKVLPEEPPVTITDVEGLVRAMLTLPKDPAVILAELLPMKPKEPKGEKRRCGG